MLSRSQANRGKNGGHGKRFFFLHCSMLFLIWENLRRPDKIGPKARGSLGLVYMENNVQQLHTTWSHYCYLLTGRFRYWPYDQGLGPGSTSCHPFSNSNSSGCCSSPDLPYHVQQWLRRQRFLQCLPIPSRERIKVLNLHFYFSVFQCISLANA